MKNKGFTLIELLAVILILGVILTIATPAITGIISTSKDKAYEKQVEIIKEAAKRWMADNPTENKDCISVYELQANGYLTSKDIKDPKTKESMGGIIKIGVAENQYTYTYEKNETCDEEDSEELENENTEDSEYIEE